MTEERIKDVEKAFYQFVLEQKIEGVDFGVVAANCIKELCLRGLLPKPRAIHLLSGLYIDGGEG
jgi:hypothetical protein